MERVRCKCCNVELNINGKFACCGCTNMMTVNGDRVSANNLDELVFMKSKDIIKNEGFLTQSDLKYQDGRRKRKVRKLNFEVR